jgi:hypothetical protein
MVHDQPSALFEAIALLLIWPLPHYVTRLASDALATRGRPKRCAPWPLRSRRAFFLLLTYGRRGNTVKTLGAHGSAVRDGAVVGAIEGSGGGLQELGVGLDLSRALPGSDDRSDRGHVAEVGGRAVRLYEFNQEAPDVICGEEPHPGENVRQRGGEQEMDPFVATILKESALVLAGFAPVGVFAALIYGLFLIAEAEISRVARYRECCCGPSLPGMLVQVRGAPAWITVSEISRVCVSFCVSWR